MQLVKMELRGFKSFADKTTLTFDTGITAIVGPNGSGKSNISDAVRWVMGEQNVRQLRGQKAEDIIFAGTETRRPQGAAEVSLYFDNTDHTLDVEFTEVVITRRLFRSGESEFYINKRPCRLKDIHVLFADTGIGQDSMAVIGQNRVDRILNSKPEERRVIFEEVAGISRYKGRKAEGLKKIAETERNLERIQDMMSLLTERLAPMAKEAEKLKRFRQLDQERISYEGTLTLQELRNFERLVAKVENSRLTAVSERDDAAKAVYDAEAKRQALVDTMAREGEELRRLDEGALRAHNELDSLTSRHEACVQRQSEFSRRHDELAVEEQALQAKQAEQTERLRAGEAQQEQYETTLAAARQGLALSETLFHEAETKAAEANQALAARTAAKAQTQQDLVVSRHDRDELRRRLQENRAQCDACKEDLEACEKAQAEHREALQAVQAETAQAAQTLADTQRLVTASKAEMDTLQQQMVAAEKDYRNAHNKSASLEQRIRVLSSMEQEHEGLGRAVKVVLDAKTPWRDGICGVVGELCTIPKELTTALDIALGGASRYIVTDTEGTAKQAIRYLKERRAGRTTFLPLQTIRPRRRTGDEEQAVHEAGSLGFANDVIAYDAAYGDIFASLLGKTILVKTVDEAAAIAKKYHYRLRLVCLDGTLFNPGGSLTGGSTKNAEGSFISRRALLEELKKEWDEAKQIVATAVTAGKDMRRRVETLQRDVEAKEEQLRQAELDKAARSWQEKQLQDALTQDREALQKGHDQYQALQAARADIQAQLVAVEEKIEALQTVPTGDTQALETALAQAEAEVNQCRKQWNEQEVAVATLQEQVRHGAAQVVQFTQWLAGAKDDAARLAERQGQLAKDEAETASLLVQLAANIEAKTAETKRCDAEKEAFYKAKEENFQKHKALEEELTDLRAREQDWRQRLNTYDVQLEKYNAEVRRSEERLALQGLTRQEAMERRREGSLKELQAKVECLRHDISDLGQINPNAEVEYNAAVEKEAFYTKQCDDLRESRTKLEAIVAEIDAAMATQFTKAFGEIRGHFQQIFSRLFGGGKAHLRLTDTRDILATGVDISIQPPGKKEQPLTLLSGGERALTVIALLLAFLVYHPAPFCLVDEVDAALDEANVERMARYLKNYSGHTQFIVITHRRKTMEAANTLQGVTMEEKGVSRLLTVKVDDVLEKGR